MMTRTFAVHVRQRLNATSHGSLLAMTYCKHCGTDDATLRWQADKIDELEAVVTELQEQITQVKFVAVPGTRIGEEKLNTTEARMLSLLLTQDSVSNQALFHCCKRKPHALVVDMNVI